MPKLLGLIFTHIFLIIAPIFLILFYLLVKKIAHKKALQDKKNGMIIEKMRCEIFSSSLFFFLSSFSIFGFF